MKTLLIASLSVLLLACQGEGAAPAASTISPAAAAIDAATPATKNKDTEGGGTAMDIDSLVPDKYVKVAVEKGDLNGDGVADALLLVEESDNKSLISGEGAKRSLLIVVGDASGKFRVVKRNDNIIPCKTCGGIAGDPFAYMKAEKNGFTVVVAGGSRERWSAEYSFVYMGDSDDWFLSAVKKEVTDIETDKRMERQLTPDELGEIKFSDFNPSSVPEVVLP